MNFQQLRDVFETECCGKCAVPLPGPGSAVRAVIERAQSGEAALYAR